MKMVALYPGHMSGGGGGGGGGGGERGGCGLGQSTR